MEPCDHEKVYADYVLTSLPPQKPWICKKCGERGYETAVTSVGTTKETYDDLLKKFSERR